MNAKIFYEKDFIELLNNKNLFKMAQKDILDAIDKSGMYNSLDSSGLSNIKNNKKGRHLPYEFFEDIEKGKSLARELAKVLIGKLTQAAKSNIKRYLDNYLIGNGKIELCESMEELESFFYDVISNTNKNSDEIIPENQIETEALHSLNIPQYRPRATGELIGRKGMIAKINNTLSARGLVILNGMRGIGKSHLTQHYVKSAESRYKNIYRVFFDTDIKKTIQNMYPNLNEPISDSQKYLQMLDNLKGNHNLLVIEDMATYTSMPHDLDELSGTGLHLIVNAWHKFPEDIFTEEIISVEPLEPKEQLTLFEKHYPPDDHTEEYLKKTSLIFQRVDNHTLAIIIIAKIMKDNDMDLDDIIDILFDDDLHLKEETSVVINSRTQRGSPIEIYEKLYNTAGLTPTEKEILMHLSIVPSVGIRRADLKDFLQLDNNNIINALVESSWVEINAGRGKNTRIWLHSIIREVVQRREEPVFATCKKFFDGIIQALCDDSIKNELRTEYATTAHFAAKRVTFVQSTEILYLSELAKHVMKSGLFAKSVELYEKALETFNESHKNISVKTQLYHGIAQAYKSNGEYHQALTFSKKALKILEESNAPEDHITTVYSTLAIIYRKQAEYEKALEYFKKVETVYEKDAKEKELSDTYNDMALMFLNLADYKKSLEYNNKALNIRKGLTPQNQEYDLNIAFSHNNIGTCYCKMGETDKAIYHHKEALSIRERWLDRTCHPYIATTINNLGIDYITKGGNDNVKIALNYFTEALDIRKKAHPANHPNIAWSYHNMGWAYMQLGELKAALDLYMNAYEIRKITLSETHPTVGVNLYEIGRIYYLDDKYKKAKEFLQKALDIQVTRLGATHPESLDTKELLGKIFASCD